MGSPQETPGVLEAGELRLPLGELRFRFSRSSGPGGQHVNRSETRVELLFDVLNSPSLTDHQRTRILNRLAGQIDGEGVLHIFSSTTRSQAENRADAGAPAAVAAGRGAEAAQTPHWHKAHGCQPRAADVGEARALANKTGAPRIAGTPVG